MIELAEYTLLAIVSLALLTIVWSTLRYGISPMPTSAIVRDAMLELIPVEQEGELHELGAGWGTLAIAIARRCPKAQVIAHEGSVFPFLICWVRARALNNITVRFGDFMRTDLRTARGVVTYLWTGGMLQLAPKFDAELRADCWVLTHTFALRGREAKVTRTVDDVYRTTILLYADHPPAPRQPSSP